MTLTTRIITATAIAGALVACKAHAQDAWPSRQVTAVVPFPVGQGIDVMARVLTTEMNRITGQPFTVMNAKVQSAQSAPRRWRAPSPMATRC